MTREQVLNATHEQLNEWTLSALGIEYTEEPEKTGNALLGAGNPVWFRDIDGKMGITKKGIVEAWDPAENIKDAWELVDKMHQNGECLSLVYQNILFPDDLNRFGWKAEFRHKDIWAIGGTAPEAICKAFLMSKEEK